MPAQSARTVGPGAVAARRQLSITRPEGINQSPSDHYDRRTRSAYGIHNSFDNNPMLPEPWPVRFINALSVRGRQVRMRYWAQSNTGQVPGTGDGYADKLQTQWRRGSASGGTRADPIVQNAQIPTQMAAWPHQIGAPGHSGPALSNYGMDSRVSVAGQVNGRRPMYLPRFEGGQIRLKTETSQRAGEYLPTRFSVVPPMRIVRMHRYGTGMMAGSAQFGTRQTWGQGEDCIVVSPVNVITGMKSRGIISARGVLSPKQGTGRERIPAIFTPASIQ